MSGSAHTRAAAHASMRARIRRGAIPAQAKEK
jgi:hypothetical protein